MRVNKLETMNLEVESEIIFADLLDKVHEKNPVVSKRPFVNIDGNIFYNPSDKARAATKENLSMAQLQAKGTFSQNPQLIIITDHNLKDDLKVMVKIL